MLKICRKIKQLFSRKKEIIDPLLVETLQQCWETQKIIISHRNQQGKVTIKQVDIPNS